MIVWDVRLKDADGVTVAHIDQYDSFYFQVTRNSMGSYILRMASTNIHLSKFELDGLVEFWWSNPEIGIAWRKEFVGFHRSFRYYSRDNGAYIVESYGKGLLHLLDRRVVDEAAGSSGAVKSGKAETIVKAFVDEQCGPSAGARAIPGLSIETDAAQGNTLTNVRAPYKSVLSVAQEICILGGGDIGVEESGGNYTFKWYQGQRGTDRTGSVVFSLERGNMADAQLIFSRLDEINAVLVGGAGQETERATTWRTTASLIDDSPINRIEAFRDARDASTTAELEARGDETLEESKPRVKLDYTTVQTDGCAYGKHYFMGDKVAATVWGYAADKIISGLQVTVNAQRGTDMGIFQVETEDA